MRNDFIDTYEMRLYLGQEYPDRKQVNEGINRCAEAMGSGRLLRPDRKHTTRHLGRWKTTAFYGYGVTELAIEDYWFKRIYRTCLIARCRPAIALHPEDPYSLTGVDEYSAAADAFNRMIAELNRFMGEKPLPCLEEWQARRIDYAFQYRTPFYGPTMDMVLKCCGPAADGVRIYKSSVQIIKSKCIVNFYDKTVQRNLEDEAHMLRFEVQCLPDYLYKMESEGRVKDLSLKSLWNRDLALSVVANRITKLMGSGDFCSLESAKMQLDRVKYVSEEEKETVYELLKFSIRPQVSRKVFWESVMMLANMNESTPRRVKDRIARILERLNVNEIVIPKSWNIASLPNPVGVIKHSLKAAEQEGENHA